MIRLKDHLKEKNLRISCNGKVLSISAAAAFEDNPYFFSYRFKAARELTAPNIEKMLNDTGTSTYYVFNEVPLC